MKTIYKFSVANLRAILADTMSNQGPDEMKDQVTGCANCGDLTIFHFCPACSNTRYNQSLAEHYARLESDEHKD